MTYTPDEVDFARRIAAYVPTCEGLPTVFADGAWFVHLRAQYPYEPAGPAYKHPFAYGHIMRWLQGRWGEGMFIAKLRHGSRYDGKKPWSFEALPSDGEFKGAMIGAFATEIEAIVWACCNAPERVTVTP